tara:strand:+ start:1671 stop:2378 length:708 start_codon:yes stop_codon:yes gene_type:complete
MVKEKLKKKSKKIPKKINKNLIKEEVVSKKEIKKENLQLSIFFLMICLVFASFLIPYFYMENLKSFEFAGIGWTIERLGEIEIYHGRFESIGISNLNYNIYLRNDPRENTVSAKGNFSNFKYGGFISFDKNIEICRGEASRVMVDLGSFLRSGVGLRNLEVATIDYELSSNSNRPYVNCLNNPDRTVIIIKKGEENSIEQVKNYEFCYILEINNCNDSSSVEKFMIEVISEFKER